MRTRCLGIDLSATHISTRQVLSSRSHRRQIQPAVRGSPRGPGDAAQDQDAEKRVVESPGVMAEDADEDPALAVLLCPEKGLGGAVFDACGEDVNLRRIAGQLPVAFIDEANLVEAARDWMVAIRKGQLERAVAEARLTAAPGQ